MIERIGPKLPIFGVSRVPAVAPVPPVQLQTQRDSVDTRKRIVYPTDKVDYFAQKVIEAASIPIRKRDNLKNINIAYSGQVADKNILQFSAEFPYKISPRVIEVVKYRNSSVALERIEQEDLGDFILSQLGQIEEAIVKASQGKLIPETTQHNIYVPTFWQLRNKSQNKA